jgi:hypothetical protein
MMGKPDGTCGCNSWGDVWQEFHPLHPARAPLVGHKLPKNCMDVRTLCVIRKTKSELFPQECDHSPHNDNGHIRGDGQAVAGSAYASCTGQARRPCKPYKECSTAT